MPRLPQASDLNGVSPQAARSFVNMPVPDIAGTTGAIARGLSDVGGAISTFDTERRKKIAAQERFDTKMGLLKAEEAYAERARELDPLDPDYVEKKKALYREAYAPVLSGVKDPENKQLFDLSSYEGFVNIGVRAGEEHKAARGKKAEIDLAGYVDGVRKRVREGTYVGDPIADINQMLDDNQDIDQLTRETLRPALTKRVNEDLFEVEFENITTGGISVTSSVKTAAANAAANAGPGAPPWLEDYLLRTAMIESRGGRMKINPENPEVVGTWQIHSNTAKDAKIALEDRADDEKSAAAATRIAMRDYKMLTEMLGREPTQAELYLAHQQGIGGGPKLLANPDKKAVDVVGRKAVEQNLPKGLRGKADSITAGQFAEYVMRKFDGTAGGGIDAEDTLQTLRLTDAYQRMTPEEQDAAEKSALDRIEKVNKEVQTAAKIQLQRDTVDTAIRDYDDRIKAADYIKQSISDPDTREDALTMLNKEYERIDKAQKEQAEERYNTAYEGISEALDKGDIAAAQKIADTAEVSGEERTKLKDRIAKGDAKKDDPKVLDGLVALKIGNEQERRYFANADGQGLNIAHLRHVLSRDTLEKLEKEQETYRKQYEKNPKLPMYDDVGKMLDLKVRGLGIKTGDKATETDIRYYESIRAIASRNTEAAVERLGRALTPSEMEKVLDETFMQFRGEKPGRLYGTNPATLNMKDVLERFDERATRYDLIPDDLVEEAVQGLIDNGEPVTPENLLEALTLAEDQGVFAERKRQRETKNEAQ